jgi:hypothetical protein
MRHLLDEWMSTKRMHKVKFEMVQSQVWTFMQRLNLPNDLMNTQSLYAMILLLFPSVNEQLFIRNSGYSQIVPHLDQIWVPFFEIFKENNIRKRSQFFSNPLIKNLWRLVFVDLWPDLVKQHLRRLRSFSVDGEDRFRFLFMDMQHV